MIPSLLLNRNIIISLGLMAAIVGLYWYVSTLKSDIQKLKLEVTSYMVKYVNEQRQSELYRVALDKQNESIKKIESDREKAIVELEAWKSKPAEIKYKVITKIREIKSDDCKDIKNVISSVRKLDYNSLYH